MKLAVTLLSTASVILASQQALGDDGNCSLWVENGQLCIARDQSSKECRGLDPNKVEGIEQFRCLSQPLNTIPNCERVTIAQNTFIILRPFKIRYGAMLVVRGASKKLYSEERIQSSCSTLIIRR
jgi:hypothetical protein